MSVQTKTAGREMSKGGTIIGWWTPHSGGGPIGTTVIETRNDFGVVERVELGAILGAGKMGELWLEGGRCVWDTTQAALAGTVLETDQQFETILPVVPEYALLTTSKKTGEILRCDSSETRCGADETRKRLLKAYAASGQRVLVEIRRRATATSDVDRPEGFRL